jgi:hypothetical protein
MGRELAAAHPGWIAFEELPGFSHNSIVDAVVTRFATIEGE